MKGYFTVVYFLILSFVPTLAIAKETKTHLLLEAETFQHVCWYQDKKYSEGAIIEVGSTLLICAIKHKNQPNSQLGWFKLDEKGNVIYPKKPTKITVN